jgi:hypothetical protein
MASSLSRRAIPRGERLGGILLEDATDDLGFVLDDHALALARA